MTPVCAPDNYGATRAPARRRRRADPQSAGSEPVDGCAARGISLVSLAALELTGLAPKANTPAGALTLLERKRLELLLAERLRFETLLSEQSATFSSLSATEVDREIKRALRRIADFFKADWGSLAELSHDTRVARITHSWVTEGAAPRPATVSLSEIPWVMGQLQGGEMVRFSRVEELPADVKARFDLVGGRVFLNT